MQNADKLGADGLKVQGTFALGPVGLDRKQACLGLKVEGVRTLTVIKNREA